MELHALIAEWQQALAAEIEAVKKKGYSSTSVRVNNGQLIGQTGDNFLYQFILDNPLNVPDDSPVRVKVGNESYDSSIVAVSQFEITIAVSANIGGFVPEATIITDATFLLKALSDQWEKVNSQEIRLNETLVLQLLNYRKFVTSRKSPSPSSPVSHHGKSRSANREQTESVSASLGNDVTFIWGPPGTGKTTTIAWIAEAFLHRAMSVLVVAHTNVAVGKAILDIVKVLEHSQEPDLSIALKQGKVIRFGPTQLEDVSPDVRLDEIIRKRSEFLKAEQETLTIQREKIERSLHTIYEHLKLWQNLHEAETQVTELTKNLSATQQKRETLTLRLEQSTEQLAEVSAKLEEAERAGTLKRIFFRLDPKQLRIQRDRVDYEQRTIRETLTAAKSQVADIEAQLQRAKWHLSEIRAGIEKRRSHGLTEEAILQRESKRLEEESHRLAVRLKEIEALLASIEEEVLRAARLIATTLTRAYLNKTVCTRTFDVVIADEASMAAIPALCFATGLSAGKVIIVGDFRQLAPIATADDEKQPNELVRKWLKTDVFEHAGIRSAVDEDRGKKDGRLVQLKQQYRMHHAIATISDKLVGYEYENRTDPNEGLEVQPFPGRPLVLVDTSDINPWCSHDPNYSRFNIYSAVVAAHLAKQVIDSNSNSGDKPITVGITTPYAMQAKLIRKVLESWGDTYADFKRITVGSVHKFQGNERDVIIFDVADGPNLGIGKPLQGNEEAKRLLNVAVTRPKSKLLVIANRRYCLSKITSEFTLKQLLEMLVDEAICVNSGDVVGSYFHPDVAAAEAATHPRPLNVSFSETTLVRETDFYALFAQDLSEACRRVVIFTPFISHRRIGQLMNSLLTSMSAGAKVYIVTRPESSQQSMFGEEDKAALQYLKQVGVKIITKYKAQNTGKEMHEKIAIIDDYIVWFGSLNIGSNDPRNTSEGMLRFNSAAVANEFKRLWAVDELIKEIETEKERTSNLEALKTFAGQQPCPICRHPMNIKINSRDRSPFYACPRCEKSTANIPVRILESFINKLEMQCENVECKRCKPGVCGGNIVLKRSKGRVFLGCEHYPDCKETAQFSTLF